MKTEMTRPTWEDVVFESRNKEYGAYIIRKSYQENISKSSLVAILIAAFSLGITEFAQLINVDITKLERIVDPGPGLPTVPKIKQDPPLRKEPARSEPRANHNVLERIVTQEVAEAPPKELQQSAQTGNVTGRGTEETMPSIDIGVQAEATPVVEVPKVFEHPEVMPEYEGGVSAMIRFISKNVHYPSAARATGQEGTVYVRFVVNDQGRVVDVEVLRGVNAMLDREAIRVVALMKKWKPGSQNNMAVSVRMVLPIKFKLENE